MTSALVWGCIVLQVAIGLSGANNIVFNRPAFQRDTYQKSVATNAVDGNVKTSSCTTMNNVGTWWAVPLARRRRVQGVKVTSKLDNWAYRLDNFIVALSNTKPTQGQPLKEGTYTQCAQFSGRVTPGVPVYVTCADFQPSFEYVIILSTLTKANAICLAEVEVYAAPPNLAFEQPAFMSSQIGDFSGSRAVDVNKASKACTKQSSVGAWWAVTLAKPVQVYGVRVTSPKDDYAYRLDNFMVGVTNIKPEIGKPILEATYIVCGQYKGRPAQDVPVYVTCARNNHAFKYVFVMSTLNKADSICLADVEVYGDDRYNYALERKSFQIDTYSKAYASRANDGNYQTASCTSMNNFQPWWAVKFDVPISPRRVRVTNDNNKNYGYRLNDFRVWLSNNPPTVGRPADTEKFTLCEKFDGKVPLAQSVFVMCPESTEKYQYLIVQGSLTKANAICLTEVEVSNDVFDSCESKPCKIGESCEMIDEMFHSCVEVVDPCESSPCKNGGICTRVSAVEFSCSCAQGWIGSDCSTEEDPCATGPCKNGGTCKSSGGGEFSCSCVPGWSGDYCTTEVNVCKISNPCQNGGTCVKFGDSYDCKCAPTWAGKTCEVGSEACKMVDPRARVNCGWGGITADECSKRSCCFDDTVRGVPYCFYTSYECDELDASDRVNCGWSGITYFQCINRGCCYDDDPSTNQGLVCFRKENPDCVGVEAADRVARGDDGIQPNKCDAQDWCFDSSVTDQSLWCFTRA